MFGLLVTSLAFFAGFLAIFSVNLLITDVFLKDRERTRKRLEAENLLRERQRTREALQGQDLNQIAAEAMQETGDHKSLLERLDDLIEQSGTEMTVAKVLGIGVAVGVAAGLVSGLLARSFLVGPLCGLAFCVTPLLYVQFKRRQRLQKLLFQLPDALELMSRILRSGQTISQAMLAVATEFKSPIAQEFGCCYEQQNLGLSMDVALRDLASRTGLLEVRIFVLGLLIHRRSGGNLTELLDSLASLIRERQKLRGKVRALTAEGRFQAIALLVLPIVAFLGLFLVSHDYAMKLLDYPWLLIGCAISMGFGALWIRKIVNFDF
jgi:tight adherence protein B